MSQSRFRKRGILLSLMLYALFFVSCIDGYKDEFLWTPGVENAQLESPSIDDVVITPSADGTSVKIEWPVVPGAGGYQFSLYIADDPNDLVPIGVENEVVDGCVVEREMQEDTQYKIILKTLGNSKYNNKDATSVTEKVFSTLLPVTAVIPSGSNLSEYFVSNPIPPSTSELCYELESGGTYTMNGDVATGLTSVTFRGDKLNHAKLAMTNGAFLTDGAGLKLKFIDIDCSSFEGTSVISLNTTINSQVELSAGGYVVIPTTSPIALQSCKITGLYQRLFYDNNKKYAIGTFLIKDCIVGQNVSSKVQLLRSQQTVFKDLTLTNSTFYNEKTNEGYFMQLQGGKVDGVKPISETWTNANLTITGCTFWQIVKGDQMGNYSNNFAQKGNNITIQRCIFVDCGNKSVIRRLGGGNGNATLTCGFNSYWYDGAFVEGELNSNPKDISGTHLTEDPKLKDPANGDFTPLGASQIANRTGDPRWLSEE